MDSPMKIKNRRTLLLSTVGMGAAALGKVYGDPASSGAYPTTSAESAAGVTPTSCVYAPDDVRRYGADPNGTADSAAAFASASKAAKFITLAPGTYLIKSDIAIGPVVIFQTGAILKPAHNVTVVFSELSSCIQAGPFQIFDLSLGGLVLLPQANTVCPAEWWGAKGDYKKRDNEIPINQALLAVSAAAAVSGGEVTLERGGFYVSDAIYLRQNTWLRGKGKFYTVLCPGTVFRSNSYMIVARDESHPMFNCPVVDLRLDANNDPNVVAVIYAPAWQQKCGTQNVYISNFKTHGIRLDTGYGGAAQLTIRQTEIYTAADPLMSSACIYADYSNAVVGWIDITLQEVDFGCSQASVTFQNGLIAGTVQADLASPWPHESGAWNVFFSSSENRTASLTKGGKVATWLAGLKRETSASATARSPNAVGMIANGRIVLACLDVHSEFIAHAFELQGAATISGTAIKCDGNNSVNALFHISPNWTGHINATSVKQGGAANLIVDSSRPYPLANQVPHDDQLVWPPSPARAFATANVIGGGLPVLAYGIGITSILHAGTGIQRLTMSPGASDLSSYDVIGTSADPSAPVVSIRKRSANSFDVFTFNTRGEPADAAEFSVKVYHKS
jgi:hypothetical protein